LDIKKIQNGTSLIPGAKKERKIDQKIEFQKTLKDAQTNAKVSNPSPSAVSVPEKGEIVPEPSFNLMALPILPGLEDITQVRSQGIKAAENTLDLLEKYQKAVGDPQMTLKKIDRIVESLDQEVQSLNSLSEKLPVSDPLQRITEEIRVVSSVEIEKFKRGDYL
jgi:hypothetical protein